MIWNWNKYYRTLEGRRYLESVRWRDLALIEWEAILEKMREVKK